MTVTERNEDDENEEYVMFGARSKYAAGDRRLRNKKR